MAMVQNPWYHFWDSTTHFRTDFGDWLMSTGGTTWVLPHGQSPQPSPRLLSQLGLRETMPEPGPRKSEVGDRGLGVGGGFGCPSKMENLTVGDHFLFKGLFWVLVEGTSASLGPALGVFPRMEGECRDPKACFSRSGPTGRCMADPPEP